MCTGGVFGNLALGGRLHRLWNESMALPLAGVRDEHDGPRLIGDDADAVGRVERRRLGPNDIGEGATPAT